MAKNYYIQGDPSRAQEIKAAFEKLGYNTNVNGWNFNTDCGVYFTNEADKSVDYTSIETFVNLIKTHPDYQELELPVEPKFKVGDEIFRPARNEYFKIKGIEKDNDTVWYVTTRTRIADNDKRICETVRINARYQNEYNIAPKPHYDIANFKPFDKVLVRDRNDEPWRIAFYGYYNEEAHYSHFVGTCWSKQCIPFNKDTKHLLGTTDMPSEEYINW